MAEITHLIPDLEAQDREPSTSGMSYRDQSLPVNEHFPVVLGGPGDKETTNKLEPVPPTTPGGDVRHSGAPSSPHEPRETHDHQEKYGDSAAKFWSVYVDEAKKYDKEVETWKDDMEGILIFVHFQLPPL